MPRPDQHTPAHRYHQASARSRGSVYILVLGVAVLVAVIGISSLMAVRVQRRSATTTTDRTQARELARSGIDRLMWNASTYPTGTIWRANLEADLYQNYTLGAGTFSVAGFDTIDGDLTDSGDDPVVLISVGTYGTARYVLQVTISGAGIPQPGSWKRVVQ